MRSGTRSQWARRGGVPAERRSAPPHTQLRTPSDGDEVAAAAGDQQSSNSSASLAGIHPEVLFQGGQVTAQTELHAAIGGRYPLFNPPAHPPIATIDVTQLHAFRSDLPLKKTRKKTTPLHQDGKCAH